MDKMKAFWENKFLKLWFVILILAMLVLAGRTWFISQQQTPSLAEVLSRSSGQASNDLPLFIVSLLALSLATMSAAKGYEVYKQNKAPACAVLPQEPSAVADETTKALAGLKHSLAELVKMKEWLQSENVKLKERLSDLAAELEEMTRAEKMLRKSNISLSKECERLKSENEMLMLKINSLKIKPKRTTGKKRKVKAKAKSRVTARRKRKTKK